MSPRSQPIIAPKMFDASLCHYCNKNKLDSKEKYYLPSGIAVCKECAARHGAGTASKRPTKVKRAQKVKR